MCSNCKNDYGEDGEDGEDGSRNGNEDDWEDEMGKNEKFLVQINDDGFIMVLKNSVFLTTSAITGVAIILLL